jgi:hypothetical protein
VKKLALDAAELRVDSFEAGMEESAVGTVQAHVKTWGATCVTNCATGPCYCASIESGC